MLPVPLGPHVPYPFVEHIEIVLDGQRRQLDVARPEGAPHELDELRGNPPLAVHEPQELMLLAETRLKGKRVDMGGGIAGVVVASHLVWLALMAAACGLVGRLRGPLVSGGLLLQPSR